MKNVTTQSVSLAADYAVAFDYLANPVNQKEWAINFVEDVKVVDGGYLAVTSMGELPLEIHSDKASGVIDLVYGGGAPIPTRLIPNEAGCEYLFTLLQPASVPDEVFEKESIPGLVEELQHLKTILEQ